MVIQIEFIYCGKRTCTKCPHGPYRYEYWKEDGKVRKKYLGKVEKVGVEQEKRPTKKEMDAQILVLLGQVGAEYITFHQFRSLTPSYTEAQQNEIFQHLIDEKDIIPSKGAKSSELDRGFTDSFGKKFYYFIKTATKKYRFTTL